MIPRRGKFLMSSQVMTSSPVSRLNCAEILDFFFLFSLSFLRAIISHTYWKFPRRPWLSLDPYFVENIALHLPPFQGGRLIWIWKKKKKKQHVVRAEFPGVVNLPWNTNTSACSPNTACMKEGEEDHLLSREKIKRSHGILKTRLKSDKTQKRAIMKMMWCRIT